MHVLLASGGLDSTLIAAIHHNNSPASVDIHLFIDYGQRHAVAEHRASVAVARYYGAEHVCFSLPLGRFGKSSLITGVDGPLIGAPTIVPGRNAALLSVAVSLAVARGGHFVFIGCNAVDADVYPDCRAEFLLAADDVASLGYGVRVCAPLREMDKIDIGKLLNHHGAPTDLTWSCYVGGEQQCGKCGACLQRKMALECI